MKKYKYQDLAWEMKIMEHERDGDTNRNWWAWYSHRRIDTGTGRLGNKGTSGDHTKYSTIKIGDNTEKRLGDLTKLTVTPTPVRNHQLKLVEKTPK